MRISLGDLHGVADYRRHVKATETWPTLDFQGQAIEFPEDVVVDFCLERQGDELLLTGTVKTTLSMICARCAERFASPLRLSLSERIPLSQNDDPEGQWGFGYLDTEREQLDLSEFALLAIVEQLPLQPLCRPDCRGLCPTCGQNLNQGACSCQSAAIDPRLAVLGKLLKQDSK